MNTKVEFCNAFHRIRLPSDSTLESVIEMFQKLFQVTDTLTISDSNTDPVALISNNQQFQQVVARDKGKLLRFFVQIAKKDASATATQTEAKKDVPQEAKKETKETKKSEGAKGEEDWEVVSPDLTPKLSPANDLLSKPLKDLAIADASKKPEHKDNKEVPNDSMLASMIFVNVDKGVVVVDGNLKDKEKAEKEKAEKEKAEKGKADKEKADKEKAEKEKAEKEKADKEKAEKEKADKEKADKAKPVDPAEKERLAREKADQDRLDQERREREAELAKQRQQLSAQQSDFEKKLALFEKQKQEFQNAQDELERFKKELDKKAQLTEQSKLDAKKQAASIETQRSELASKLNEVGKLRKDLENQKNLLEEKKANFSQEEKKLSTPLFNSLLVSIDGIQPQTRVKPDEKFFAGWKLKNTGLKPWTNCRLDHVRGETFKFQSIKVEEVKPDQATTLFFDLHAPEKVGAYRGVYRLANEKNSFGVELNVEIRVENSQDPMADHLAHLASMGFRDVKLNTQLLIQNKMDVNAVVNYLLSNGV